MHGESVDEKTGTGTQEAQEAQEMTSPLAPLVLLVFLFPSLIFSNDFAALHHKLDSLKFRDIGKRIA
jgi:hypothetical protein